MDHAILNLEHMVGIGVQPLALQKCVEVLQVRAVEQNDRRLMRRYRLWNRLPQRTCANHEHQHPRQDDHRSSLLSHSLSPNFAPKNLVAGTEIQSKTET